MRKKIITGVACLGLISIFAISDKQLVLADTLYGGTSLAGISSVLEGYRMVSDNADEDLKKFLENGAEEVEESAYANIAVSQVDNYVNIRSEANTESEILGKIHNECMATILNTVEQEDGTWYEISSGSVTGYIKAEYFVTGDEAAQLAAEIQKLTCRVEEGGIRLRAEDNLDSEIITLLWEGETLAVTEEGEEFIKVYVDELTEGYVSKDYVTTYIDFDEAISIEEEQAQLEEERRIAEEAQAELERARAAAANSGGGTAGSGGDSSGGGAASGGGSPSQPVAGNSGSTATRDSIVSYALQFVGNPYVWGGESLTNGADCSGFTLAVFRNFGIGLPHSAAQQSGYGSAVSAENIRPGDIVYYGGHIALYIGNGQIVHAMSSNTGIVVSSWTYSTPLAIRNIIGD